MIGRCQIESLKFGFTDYVFTPNRRRDTMKTVQLLTAAFLLLIAPTLVFGWYKTPIRNYAPSNTEAYITTQPTTSNYTCYKSQPECKGYRPFIPYCYRYWKKPPIQYSGIISAPSISYDDNCIATPPSGNYSGIIVNPDR